MNLSATHLIERNVELEFALGMALEALGKTLGAGVDEAALAGVCLCGLRRRQVIAACWYRVDHLDWSLRRTFADPLASEYRAERERLVALATRLHAFGQGGPA